MERGECQRGGRPNEQLLTLSEGLRAKAAVLAGRVWRQKISGVLWAVQRAWIVDRASQFKIFDLSNEK
jgi:hypothetical protein